MYHHYFEPELIELRKEIANHPDLMTILAVQTNTDIYVHIAEIAAYCEVVLDDWYTPNDLDKLCDILWNKLREKRGSITVHSKLI